jgi:hypothetical protein
MTFRIRMASEKWAVVAQPKRFAVQPNYYSWGGCFSRKLTKMV